MKLPFYGILNLWLLRNRIDQIDDEIYKLVQQRLVYCALTRHYKSSAYDQHREEYIMERLKKKGMMRDEVVEDVWFVLLKHGKNVQCSSDDSSDDEIC